MNSKDLEEMLRGTNPDDYRAAMNFLFNYTKRIGASDLHLVAGKPPKFRIGTELKLDPEGKFSEPIDRESTRRLVYSVLDEKQIDKYENNPDHAVDSSHDTDKAAFRIHLSQSFAGIDMTARVIPVDIPKIESLGLPNDVWSDIIKLRKGLVLITGMVGSGKSTTLAGILDRINESRYEKIVTIEDPIEYRHHDKKCTVIQRELGRDLSSFENGVKFCLRQNGDIIQIGEIRDQGTARAALTAADTGHLVLSTLHTRSGIETINRFVSLLGEDTEGSKNKFANALYAVICQQLLPYQDRKDTRILAAEVMVPNDALRTLIRDDKMHQAISAMQLGRSRSKMVLMDEHIMRLYKEGKITEETARSYALDPKYVNEEFAKIEGVKSFQALGPGTTVRQPAS